jgi:galactose mutarotase-like enzyme
MTVTLKYQDQTVTIHDGELCSYQVGGYELMHQKGSPGWGHSDTEMFPVIGPTKEANYRVQVPKGNAIQDQHGLLRELSYEHLYAKDTEAAFSKKYKAGTLVPNSKYPEKSTARLLIWPYDFQFKKSFRLTDSGLEVGFTVSGDKDMPYMIGYHPAFKLRTKEAEVQTESSTYTLQEIMAAGDRAVEVANTSELILKDEKQIRLTAKGFGHFMLWSPAASMICIEPVSFYPYEVAQPFLHEGFTYLNEKEVQFVIHIGIM